MTVPWFYALPSWIDTTAGTVTLKGAEAKHLALSLRAREGQDVMIGDGAGTVYEVELTSVSPELVVGVIRSSNRPPHERPRLVLFQALARAVKMDEVVARAAETGVWAVVPFVSPRSPVGSAEKAGERLERWRKIAFEASKVAKRAWSLVVGEPRHWPLVSGDPLSRRVIEGLLGEQDLNLLLWEEEATMSLDAALPEDSPKSIGVIVGPEGGFAADEAGVLSAAGAVPASIGSLILRTESAGSYAAMLIRNRYGLLVPGERLQLDSNTYRVSTLGCRVNKADSLEIEKELTAYGFRRVAHGEVPALWVVNTCAVTAEGMRKSRKLVRRCARSGASVVVTGCGVDLDPEAFLNAGVLKVVPNEGKSTLAGETRALVGCPGSDGAAGDWEPEGLVRVPVKVQEGCERYCTYCVVPYLRPPPSSRTIDSVLEEVRALRATGTGEVILCGIDLGSYREQGTGEGLDSLVEAVTAEAGRMWVRLSSIELNDINDSLIGLLSGDNSLCRHLHIPLQSGDERVLADMGREYTPRYFRRRVAEIRELVGGVSVTTDVMVGFPTEEDEAFRSTRSELETTGFSRVHVFKYSRRPRTAAYALDDPVDGATKHRRAAELREVARAEALRFHEGLVGRIIPVLVEATMQGEPGRLFGRAESFAGVVMEGDAGLVGGTVDVTIEAADPDVLTGSICPGSGGESGGRVSSIG